MEDSRRSFLKLAGYSFVLTGCSRLDYKAIPLLNQPEELTPGRANYYATLCAGCSAGCGIVAKSRDGRPIKLEGNDTHPLNAGGLCATGQAGVLSLYDSLRLTAPLLKGDTSTWGEVDAFVRKELRGTVRLLTGTIHSPTQRREIKRFLSSFPDGKHVMYDTLSCSALLDAHEEMFGVRALPRYRFDRAEVVVSLDADFLGTWVSPAEFTRGYAARRDPDGGFSLHVQYESRVSITGDNADERIVVAPDEIGRELERLLAKQGPVAEKLWDAAGRSLVVCGVNDIRHQRLAARLNGALGNYGRTLEMDPPSYQCQGDDAALAALRDELAAGKVDALLVAGCNPAYDLPGGLAFDKAKLVVSFAEREDETAEHAHCVSPVPHALESWGDAEPVAGLVTVQQPLIRPLGDTRPLAESLATWRGGAESAHALMRSTWHEMPYKGGFELFWSKAVHDGFTQLPAAPVTRLTREGPAVPAFPEPGDGLMVVLYEKVGPRDGRHAHNAWLQELPDPVTKVAWDNYASIAPETAERLGIEDGDVVRIGDIELPALVQPDQHERVVAIALGYGRKGTDRFHDVGPDWIEATPTVEQGGTVGVNAAPLLSFVAGQLTYVRGGITVEPTGDRHELARTQLYHSLREPAHIQGKRRPILQEATLSDYRKDPHAGAIEHHPVKGELWPDDHKYEGHRWGMTIDLTACTGCSACVIGCQAENNIPVVGRDEVQRYRDMHWMRIDRYHDRRTGTTAHQPMFCQHCANAPCETVCPVLATVHSSEGLNQQVYNRCVGTRYCANNCPYKVRRFNWFDYAHNDLLQNLVLNPDIVVRSRGVMEKCSLCVQRIQEGKAEAKRQGRPLADGDIRTACQQSCPADAIVFGDLNDPESRVSKARAAGRYFRVLEELNTKPAAGYLTLVRNRDV